MKVQSNVQNIINLKLTQYQSKNPGFSIRAFAKKLEMQPAAVSEVLKGKRRISLKLAEKIADRLQLDPTEKMHLLKDFLGPLQRPNAHRSERNEVLKMTKLKAEQFDFISDWVHFAILALMKTKRFVPESWWIAERLSITAVRANQCIARLIQLQLIQRQENGELIRTSYQMNTSDDVLNPSVQKSHLVDLEIAKKKLTEVDVNLRDFTSITFAFDINKMQEVKQLIRQFQDDVDALMEGTNRNEIYKMNTYLYPLTVVEKSIGNLK